MKRDVICIFVLNSKKNYVGRYFRDSFWQRTMDKINRFFGQIGFLCSGRFPKYFDLQKGRVSVMKNVVN